MITLEVTSKKLTDNKTHCFGLLLPESFAASALKECEQKLGVKLKIYLDKHEFKGKALQTFSMPVITNKDELYHVVVVGLGKPGKKGISGETYRRAVATLYRKVASLKQESFALVLPAAPIIKLSAQELGQQTAVALEMTSYQFNEYWTEKDRKETVIYDIFLSVPAKDKAAVTRGVKDGQIIARSVNKARQWVNLPPTSLTPPDLANKAKAIAKKTGLKCTIFDEKLMIKMGMGGLAGVGRGSDNESRLVILEYKTSKKNAPTIAFVGKGITFDSGGLSLKPAVHMETMKEDMAGAAAVINTMEALAQLKPDVNVIGVTPLAENLPSGKATKPGDILRFYNGKTAEVKNTDAEGRLVLADALAYTAEKYQPDAMIDIATLTGACAHALGPFYSGLMTQDDDLAETIEEAGEHTGDEVWRLPFSDDYKAAIKSVNADICNIGNNKYMAGATTAGLFLGHFVGDIPWAHLDIAGTAFNVPDRPYYRDGATGVGVRLLTDIAMHWE